MAAIVAEKVAGHRGGEAGRLMRNATISLLVVTLSVGLTGCQSVSTGAVGDVTVEASPTTGLRASYRARTLATLSGSGTRALAEAQKSASVGHRYLLEVTAVEADAFDVRITSERFDGVINARFGRDWTPIKFGAESQGQYTDLDVTTFPVLGEAFRLLRDLSGRWKMGQEKPWKWTMSMPPQMQVGMQGRARLKKVARLDGRPAAEFEYDASGEGEYNGSPLRVSVHGQCWIDLATGFSLETKTSSRAMFSQSGQPVLVDIKEERTLDRRDSAGL
jgi:hypothetical protein